MTIRGKAAIAGAFEHPGRELPDHSVEQIHAEVALGALADAGLSIDDVDGYLCDSTLGSFGAYTMAEYLGLRTSFVDSTDIGGSSYLAHVAHAAAAIDAGKCRVALITMGGKARSDLAFAGGASGPAAVNGFESPWGGPSVALYALSAQRHMYEFGTRPEQLAEVKVAASRHAQHNPRALLRAPVSVADVLASPMVCDPIRMLECYVVADGGGALVVVSPDVARALDRECVVVLGEGETIKHTDNGNVDLVRTGAAVSGPRAFAEAGVGPSDVDYASVYDSFTITVLMTLEDLGFCAKGEGGAFVADGGLLAPDGRLPLNSDGGALCNGHPALRGGMTKTIEAVRQLRGEAHPAVQVPDCEIALVHGTGGARSVVAPALRPSSSGGRREWLRPPGARAPRDQRDGAVLVGRRRGHAAPPPVRPLRDRDLVPAGVLSGMPLDRHVVVRGERPRLRPQLHCGARVGRAFPALARPTRRVARRRPWRVG